MENSPANEIIEKIISWIESTADFAKEQWPDYVSQFMRAQCIKTWINISIFAFFLVVLLSAAAYCIRFKCNWEGKSFEIPTFIEMGTFFPLLLLMPVTVGLINDIHNLVNIYVAPKVYLLHHLKGLIK